MDSREDSSRFNIVTTTLLTGLAAAALVATVTLAPRQVAANPAAPWFKSVAGTPCGKCHVSPGGGGALTGFGQKFQANGHKLPGK